MFTSHREIVDYWAQHQDECGLSVDWSEAEKLCWRCAHKRMLQRCHIVPRALGGDESPGNLVLLCAQCHAEAPNVADTEFMWVWLRAHAVACYGTYWQERGFREYEFIFREKPFAGITHSDELLQKASDLLKELFPRTSKHWGQGKINPATVAWVLRQVDQRARADV
ncbi:HNH endonuclease signature motif containing protein [Rudaea cellulosilytica]|uniref:HNH endonuclease n=1 Tax=Rudaea cellulosilytica TaxID=540746 RepID=UPI000526AB86